MPFVTSPSAPLRGALTGCLLVSWWALSAPAAEAACPNLCQNALYTVDADSDHVADAVECYWCAHYAGTPLDMNPQAPDTDLDGKRDDVDAYPGAGADNSELRDIDFSPSCDDPHELFEDLKDPEFNEPEHKVTWIQDFDDNPFADPVLWVAPIEPDGDFGAAVAVDDSEGVLSIHDNGKNGPEWLFDANKGGVIVYSRGGAVKTVHYAYLNGGNWVTASLGVQGVGANGTLIWGDDQPGVAFARKVNNVWTHMFCPFNGCNGAYPKKGPPINIFPPEPMRLAEGQDEGEWYLVGTDYVNAEHRPLISWAPATNTTVTLTPDEPPYKYTGWMWRGYGKDLVMTMDMIYTGDQEGPGVIRIFNATDGVWWQTIPVGPLTNRYVGSPEPFQGHDGLWYIVYVASSGTYNFSDGGSRVILAQVDPDGVAGGGANKDMLVRRVDTGDDAWDSTDEWRDPEGFAYDDDASWIYASENRIDTRRCISGL